MAAYTVADIRNAVVCMVGYRRALVVAYEAGISAQCVWMAVVARAGAAMVERESMSLVEAGWNPG